VDCYSVSPHSFFCYNFFSNYLFQFYFFDIELFVNYNYKSLQIRLNHVRKHCSFHHKTLWIATVFLTWFFPFFLVFVCFFVFFSKIIYVDFFFNIEPINNLALLFFFYKTLWIVVVFFHVIFLWFFSKLSLSIFFLILSWLRIIITIKLNHMKKAL